MKHLITAIAIFGATTLAVQTSSAQPSGAITNQVTDPTNALWDFSKLTNELQNMDLSLYKVSGKVTNEQAEIMYSDPFTQDGGGKFSGSGQTAATLIYNFDQGSMPDTNDFNASYQVGGSVTSTKGTSRLVFTTKLSGKVIESGTSGQLSAASTYTVNVDAVTGIVSGRYARSGTLAEKGKTRTASDTGTFGPNPLSDFADEVGNGTWALTLVFTQTSGNALKGAATVILDSGATYPFTFTGTYSPHKSESTLALKGVAGGKGSLLAVTLQGDNITKIAGLVSGQTVNVK